MKTTCRMQARSLPLCSALLAALLAGVPASAEQEPLRVPGPSSRLVGRDGSASSRGTAPPASSATGWWLGSAGITLVLAVCGALCVAARRYLPQAPSGSLRVVGRVSLSPRHSIYMVRAGERVWLIGTGSQGAPTLLGELTAEAATPRAATGLDVRLGEEE